MACVAGFVGALQVKTKTLALVKRAVEQLGYVSNGAARALESRRTYTIGAVYPTMYNQAFVESLHTLQQTLWGFNYQLVLAIHEYHPEREYEVVRSIVERGVDGVVLVATSHTESVFDLIRHRRLPLVVTWQSDNPRYGECIGFDNYQAAYDITKEVLVRGHRDIAAICGQSRERPTTPWLPSHRCGDWGGPKKSHRPARFSPRTTRASLPGKCSMSPAGG